MIHDMYNIRTYTVIMTTNAHKYIEIILYAQCMPACFGQICGHLQVCKIQRLDTLKV